LISQIHNCQTFVKFLEKCDPQILDCLWKEFDIRNSKVVTLDNLEEMLYALLMLHLNKDKKCEDGNDLLPTRDQCQDVVDKYVVIIKQHLSNKNYLDYNDFHCLHSWLKETNDDFQFKQPEDNNEHMKEKNITSEDLMVFVQTNTPLSKVMQDSENAKNWDPFVNISEEKQEHLFKKLNLKPKANNNSTNNNNSRRVSISASDSFGLIDLKIRKLLKKKSSFGMRILW